MSKQASEGQISGDAKDIRHFIDVYVCLCVRVSMFLFGNLWSMARLAGMKISMTPNGLCTVLVCSRSRSQKNQMGSHYVSISIC